MDQNGSKALPEIRRLSALDAAEYRELRLCGLQAHPEAFGASWAEEVEQPLAWFEKRIAGNVIFGGKTDAKPALRGVVGFHASNGAKQRHKGVLWGMFLQPEARGTGLGAALVNRVLEHAKQTVEEVRLSVVSTNVAAIRLYERAGFERYGLERRALKVEDCYHDEVLMALVLS